MPAIARPNVATVVLFMIVAACGSGLAAAAGDTPIRGAWLNERLPDDVLAYQRIPHPLGLLATPKGNALDPALRSKQNDANIRKIHEALINNVLPAIPELDDPRSRFFLSQLKSPLEMAVFAAPAPSILLAMHIGLDSAAALEAAIADFAASEPPLALAAPLDAQGIAQLNGLPAPAFLKFDTRTGLLLIQVGPAVTAEAFSAMLAALTPGKNDRMSPIERQLDQSDQGWFLWIDAERTLPVAQMFMQPENLAQLQATGLDKVRAAGLGWGVADTKGRLGIVLDVAPDGNRQYLPFVSNDLNLTSVGKPDAIGLLSLPTAEELARIESLVLDAMDQEDRDEWQALKDSLKAESGVSIEEVFGALGPELVAILDSVGDYGAIRLRNKPLFDKMLDALAGSTGIAPDSHRAHGRTFYHWSLPGDLATMDGEAMEQIGPAAQLMMRQREHIYWVQDGDFLYVASVPQPLMDRMARGGDTRIDKWLLEQKHIDASSSVLMLAGTSQKLPMRLYHMYIEILQFLADISEAEIDVWTMPTANQLSLAREGVVAFTLNLGNPYVSMNMVFESNPAEALFGGSAGTIAAVGIVAAIAIPAYQDYTVRAHVSEGFNLASQVQLEVSEYRTGTGRFPPPSEAATMGDGISGKHTESVSVMPGTGIVVVTFVDDAVPDGGQLFFEPYLQDGEISEWICSGTLEPKHMPEECRYNEVPEEVHGGA